MPAIDSYGGDIPMDPVLTKIQPAEVANPEDAEKKEWPKLQIGNTSEWRCYEGQTKKGTSSWWRSCKTTSPRVETTNL